MQLFACLMSLQDISAAAAPAAPAEQDGGLGLQEELVQQQQQEAAWRASQVLELQLQQLSELQQLHTAGLLPGYAAAELSGLDLEELDEILVGQQTPGLGWAQPGLGAGDLTTGVVNGQAHCTGNSRAFQGALWGIPCMACTHQLAWPSYTHAKTACGPGTTHPQLLPLPCMFVCSWSKRCWSPCKMAQAAPTQSQAASQAAEGCRTCVHKQGAHAPG